MKKKNDNLVNQCCTLYGLELSEFCKKFNLKESTLKTWRKELPSYGKLLFEQLIENYHLRKKLAEKNKKYLSLKSKINKESNI